MCGIIGFTGIIDAKEALVEGLRTLEYRGYDSAGISYFRENGKIRTIKTTGKVSALSEKVQSNAASDATHCGIGHTRWATHGGVSDTNSHPHTYGKVTLIHNGIIENYHELEEELAANDKYPVSQTDTEIAAMVIDSFYEGDAHDAILRATEKLDGAFAFCILFADQPGVIYAIRNVSPLVATHTEEGSIIASDMVALIQYSKDYFVVEEDQILKLTKDCIEIKDREGNTVSPNMLRINWDIAAAKKGGYQYFMLKEIYEQPEALHNTIMPRMLNGLPDFSSDGVPNSLFENVNRIILTACGTAMHAGMVGKIMMERLSRIPVTVEIASEFRYQNPILNENTLVIAISQSGETVDTLAAIRLAKERGTKTLSVVNVKGSSIARESDYVLYTHAGPEIAVASTKAYTVQLSILYLISFRLGMIRGLLSEEKAKHYMSSLMHTIQSVKKVFHYSEELELICKRLENSEHLFYIGRGLDYAISCEGSLKLKEISYIHSEVYAAGELKHGTISLITDNVPVIAFATQEHVYHKTLSNVREVRSRGAMVILITGSGLQVDASLCDHHITLPKMEDEFTPFASAVILQFLAYHTAVKKGLNVDQPRNLAKSVTVE